MPYRAYAKSVLPFVAAAGTVAAVLVAPLSAQPRPTRADTAVQCGETTIHLTSAGVAFECMSREGEVTHVFAIGDQGYDERSEAALDILREHNTRRVAAGRTRGRMGLWVRHQAPQGRAAQICNLARPLAGSPPCREATDLIYR